MNDKNSRAIAYLSVIISVASFIISLIVYYETKYTGKLIVYAPTRYGVISGKHHSNNSDKVLMCFTVYNDGNAFRNIRDVRLVMSKDSKELRAISKFDDLKRSDLSFDRSLVSSNYGVITSIPIDKKECLQLNLLFFNENDSGWKEGSKDIFKLKKGKYKAKIYLIANSGSNKHSDKYETPEFEFELVSDSTGYLNTDSKVIVSEAL